ncbi:MAG: cupredoxin family copper-binding protein [Gemmatimonadales bacterium]
MIESLAGNREKCTPASGPLMAAILLVAVPLAAPVGAQPVTERTPNLEGTWVTAPRTLHFTFSHRFEIVGGDVDVTDIFGDGKIVNYPTFALSYGMFGGASLGFRYSSNSTLAGGPNEWQPYVKWSPHPVSGGRRLSWSLMAAWNGAAGSLDGELGAQVRFGRLSLLGAVRGFSDAFDPASGTSDAALALGGGALLRVTRHLSLAADVSDHVAGPEGDPAWSAAIQIGIPYTPHTLSLLATNVTSGTLQGVSSGVPGAVYWGFEFTIPFSGIARWGEVLDPYEAEARLPAVGRGGDGRPVVEIEVKGFAFGGDDLHVPPGTTVRWVNHDPVGHTVTPDAGDWGSTLIGPGEVFEHTFSDPGKYTYHCTPHPFMKGRVVVSADAGRDDDASSEGR